MSFFSQPASDTVVPQAEAPQQESTQYPWDAVGWNAGAWCAAATGLAYASSEERASKYTFWFGEASEGNWVRQAFARAVIAEMTRIKGDQDEQQKKFDDQERMKATARERIKREKAERRISGELSPAAEVFMERLKAGMRSADGLDAIEDPDPIVPGWLYSDSLNWIAGASGTFKSFVAHDLAARYGKPGATYHGIPMTHGRALYIVAEGASMFKHRKNAWQHFNGQVENVVYYPAPIQLADFEEQMPALIAYAKAERFGMVIFDTQAMCTVGQDENTAEGMGVIINASHSLREATGGCVILVHHFDKKENGMRGSGAQYAAANTVIVTKRASDDLTVKLSTKKADGGKSKDDEGRDDITLRLDKWEPQDGGRGSLCPSKEITDDWTRKDTEILPRFDRERIGMLEIMDEFAHDGGALVADLRGVMNRLNPKKDATWESKDARSHVGALTRKRCAEKKGARYVITETGLKVLARWRQEGSAAGTPSFAERGRSPA
ncbi:MULTISPECIES: AAA family ATPase [unclassified Streptomyces]|uniref:AAA family ATPase n=1 Tax=unclassified Streptomyces TaxID=2593676 RepID=UPI00380CA33F